ncbi:MAG: hypothetical protein WC107_01985 [Patescibacteria group bacterium]
MGHTILEHEWPEGMDEARIEAQSAHVADRFVLLGTDVEAVVGQIEGIVDVATYFATLVSVRQPVMDREDQEDGSVLVTVYTDENHVLAVMDMILTVDGNDVIVTIPEPLVDEQPGEVAE